MNFDQLRLRVLTFLNYRSRFASIPGFMEAYVEENQKLLWIRMNVLICLGIVLYLSLSVFDFVQYPEQALFFLLLRVIFCSILVFTLFTDRWEWGRRYRFPLSFVTSACGDFVCSFICTSTEGWACSYFAGNILLAVSVALFLPWSPRQWAFYSVVCFTGYFGLNLINHEPSFATVIPVMFLITCYALCFGATIAAESGRMEQLLARLEVEKAHEELMALDQAKARFFANTNHELRTPLALIIGPLEALLKKRSLSLSQEVLDSLVANGRRLLRQVNALLDLSKVDAGNMRCDLEVGNMGALLQELVAAARPAAIERRQQFVELGLGDVPNSMFDHEKIETIAANLISNAIKFTPAHGKIEIYAHVNGQSIVFGVKDTGRGIPAASLSKIFERFHQVDNSQTRVEKGTGLGLSVAKSFAEVHGGTIGVESSDGQGAHFFVQIPFAVPELGAAVASEAKSKSTAKTLLADVYADEGTHFTGQNVEELNAKVMLANSARRAVILYVDDNKNLRDFVGQTLSAHYTVLLACDGRQGLQEAKKYHPALILSDLMMPYMSGTELCEQIRQDAELNQTPFVLLTAKSTLEARIDGLAHGADDYLSKPFVEDELFARIKNLLALRSHQQKLHQQMRAARDIQRALLPPLNQQVGDYLIETVYQPAEELSGDFFDTIVQGDYLYIYLADVTNHGTASAQVTYLIKEAVRQILQHTPNIELSQLFLNLRESYGKYDLPYDVSIQFLKLHMPSGQLLHLRSSSPEPVLITPELRTEALWVRPSPRLINKDAENEEIPVETIQFEERQSIYMFTDGAYEFGTAKTPEFGIRRFTRLLTKHHSEKWPEGLMAELTAQNMSSNFSDDVSILRVTRNSSARSARAAI